jgi:NosR/NirI family transcriptional regulator, nitrous oxide reductase regulator
LFKERTLRDLAKLREISPDDEPILLIERGHHGLVSKDFIRNTTPDLISAEQDGLPIAIKDADLFIDLRPEIPDGVAMILRTDRRLGFDPVGEWTLSLHALRAHGMFQPEYGRELFSLEMQGDRRFFLVEEPEQARPQWLEAIFGRLADIAILGVVLIVAVLAMTFQKRLAAWHYFPQFRFGFMAVILGFIGWWGQGQLSIVTPLAALNALRDGKSFAFLLYDPFSLLIWIVSLLGFFIWGRALFCGWLCPFGAFQEIVGKIAQRLKLPQFTLSNRVEAKAVWVKYGVLAALVLTTLYRPAELHSAAEIEPFKTAISVFFLREWYFVAYALLCLLASLFYYKAFCRFLCPLGALMAIGGLFRQRDFIERRVECGRPCQLCRVKCSYGAIKPTGEIKYNECFGCLDCVAILEDDSRCVPKILAKKGRSIR